MLVSQGFTRREMLARAGAVVGAAALPTLAGSMACAAPSRPSFVKKALHFKQLSGNRIKCQLCPRECEVGDKERGFCGSRENRGGTYYTLVYGRAAAVNIDPIEKKPFFHVTPSAAAFSIATAGCNMDCKDCQNWELSQSRPEQIDRVYNLPPSKVIGTARQYHAPVVAYTYTEPVTFYEYMLDTAKLGRKSGVKSVMVSNGYIQAEPMKAVCKYLDAVKIDLKSFRNDFYVKYCRGTLEPVLDTIKLVHKLGKWLELVYLVLPGLNDQDSEIIQMCAWLRKTVGRDVPLHFSRFHPNYQLKNLPPTPTKTLQRVKATAEKQGMSYVYIGNIPGDDAASTDCPKCGTRVIRRNGFQVLSNKLQAGKCPKCGTKIPGVWA
jgi:pyruvate formate lyase activating enzyme